MAVRTKAEESKKTLLVNDVIQTNEVKILKPLVSSKTRKQNELLKQQLKLVKNKQVRAVPDGYYTGLINDMHKDYRNFTDKGTFLQMEYLTPLIQQTKQTSQLIDRFNEETRLEERKLEKFKAPITLNASSIQCTLPSDYHRLENLSPLSFLTQYGKPSMNREQTILKLIRRIHRDATIEIEDAKDIVSEYFNQYKTHEDINELFSFLDLNATNTFQRREIVAICCYAERYFLHRLAKNETIVFQRPLQELIDFEFLKRKLDRLTLTDGLQRVMKTLEAPIVNSSDLTVK